MSPGSKSKSKKLSNRAANKQQKVSLKSSNLHAEGGKSAPTSAYNQASGTFHPIEISTTAPLITMQKNTQLTVDEMEEHSLSSPGTTTDYDSVSNNDSCSGESEDQKEKVTTSTAPHSDSIPIPGSDADKRDKIRQKNERKHQRQREKRAQELHMRCSGYLMSWKLEALTRQLVIMGFSSECATMALKVNEGRMEESVAWLLQEVEENNEHVKTNPDDGGAQMKLDISDELAKLADLEMKYRCSKQEVERAVIACEGDLDKAEENLKSQKRELAAAAGKQKIDEAGEVIRWNDKLRMSSDQNTLVTNQEKGVPSVSNQQLQQMDERYLNYANTAVTGVMFQESVDRNLQSLRTQQMPDWVRSQLAAAEAIAKRWPSTSSNPPVSHPLGSRLQFPVPSAKSDSQYPIFSSEVKTNVQAGSLREPFVMQRLAATSIGASPPTGWYSNGISSMEMMASIANVGHNLHTAGLNGSGPPQFYPRSHSQFFVSSDSTSARRWNLTGDLQVSQASPLVAPASLGLFSNWGSLGSSSSVDWSSDGSLSQRDYSSIDWSLDLKQLRPSDTWSTMIMGEQARARSVVNGVYDPGLQDSRSVMAKPSASATSREWTTPFAGKDLFGVPRRQFVASPSL